MSEIQNQVFDPSASPSRESGFQYSRTKSNDGPGPVRHRELRLGFIGRLLIHARQRITWSPTLIACELWGLLINIGAHREIVATLKLRPFDEIAKNDPSLALKYVVPKYLARGFTVSERVSCFLHHYRRLHAALPESVLRQILQREVTLHEIAEGGNRFTFTLSFPEPHNDKEGELSLNLQVDGKAIFNLSFTIVPGWVLKSEAPEALLISRLQGKPGCNSQIRLARRALNDYSPRSLLLAALQGIADALGVREIEAVSATNQKSYVEGFPTIFENGYDRFFAKAGMVKTSVGFFSGSIPIEGRALESFKGRARLRARKRRARRQQIRSACADFLLKITCRAADSDSGTSSLDPFRATVESEPSPVLFCTSDCDRNFQPGDCHLFWTETK